MANVVRLSATEAHFIAYVRGLTDQERADLVQIMKHPDQARMSRMLDELLAEKAAGRTRQWLADRLHDLAWKLPTLH